MTSTVYNSNPFSIQTPEEISAQDAHSLFVNVFSDFPKLLNEGHTFIHGPRGSGKSMMFRYMQPDCQCLEHECTVSDLPFYGVYIPIKNTGLHITEMSRLTDTYVNGMLNEHFMCTYIANKTFASVSTAVSNNRPEWRNEIRQFALDSFARLMRQSGWSKTFPDLGTIDDVSDIFRHLASICDDAFKEALRYVRKLTFKKELPEYDGPLCGYFDFLHPILRDLKGLVFMPDGPVYLMIDDADNLSYTQTLILNSWVASRTSSDISLKISTQLNYKTFLTVTKQYINAPHDYNDVNISAVYTTSYKTKYRDRVRAIIERRLKLANIDATPETFFPNYALQERKIDELKEKLRQNWELEKRSYRPEDDAVRYARPEYMRTLAGKSKSLSTYSYSGFEQLVHISSGLIRFFLEPASIMFSDEQTRTGTAKILHISPAIQNEVIRRQANEFMFGEIEKLQKEQGQESAYYVKVKRLNSIIHALGATFREILFSEQRRERRVFSIAFSDEPDDEVREVLDFGVVFGFFHLTSIGNKEGTGRTRLYVLTRRLAPFFGLDPTGFAGYLFITNSQIKEVMYTGKTLRKIQQESATSIEQFELPFGD